jgi:hypothetical protein
MDNIFQILIFLFVIYTIFNSIFGKKKPQRPQNNFPRDETGEAETQASPQSQDSSVDILQDLFGFKIPKSGDEYENLPRRTIPRDLETGLPGVENQIDPKKKDIQDINYDQLPSIELQKNIIVVEEPHMAYEVAPSFNRRTVELKQKIKNPITLRELYLISEIINKPKAIRR